MVEKNCRACSHSYMEPDSPLICGHPDSGSFGLSVRRDPVEHCGPERSKFEQHPKRHADGSLKTLGEIKAMENRNTALDVLDGAKR